MPKTSALLPLEKEKFLITIADFGLLTEENIEEFQNADIKLIVAGGKEWEVPETERGTALS